MAINLDEIISSATSVDDMVAALQNETAAQLRTRQQTMKLAEAGQSALNPLQWLKGMLDPRSPSGTVANADAYRKYYMEAVSNNEAPMTLQEFLKTMETQRRTKNEGA